MQTDYYAGGVRVIRDGVPCRVAYVPDNAAFKEKLLMAAAGEIEWEPDADHPAFSFIPVDREGERAKRRAAAKPAAKCTGNARAYYAGGYRATFNGVPCRLARKPSANVMQIMRQTATYAPLSSLEVGKREEAYKRNGRKCGDYLFMSEQQWLATLEPVEIAPEPVAAPTAPVEAPEPVVIVEPVTQRLEAPTPLPAPVAPRHPRDRRQRVRLADKLAARRAKVMRR